MQILTKQENGLKALVLSDLHIFNMNDINSIMKLLLKLEKNEYDVIYLVGDILDSTNVLQMDNTFTAKIIELISYFGRIAPTYIVYGSHDLSYRTIYNNWSSDKRTFQSKFIDKVAGLSNVKVLENETVDLGNGYTISGINPSLNYAISTPDGNNKILDKEIEKYEFLSSLDSNNTNTLLCHYPNVIMYLHKLCIIPYVDLSIAGHNHNGCTQFRFIPVEGILNLFGQKNRGLITPGKSTSISDTEVLRGDIDVSSYNIMLMNPAFKTLSASSGLEKFDWMFYKGYSEVEYIPQRTLKK